MIAQIDEGMPCFIAEPEDPDESLGDDEHVPVEIRGLERIFHLKLSEEITSVAVTMHELVHEQNSDLFCRKVRLALQRGLTSAKRGRKAFSSKTKKVSLQKGSHW